MSLWIKRFQKQIDKTMNTFYVVKEKENLNNGKAFFFFALSADEQDANTLKRQNPHTYSEKIETNLSYNEVFEKLCSSIEREIKELNKDVE